MKPDESYFDRQRKGKHGRGGTSGKVAVFWLLKRNGHIYTLAVVITLLSIIHEQVKPDSIVYTDYCYQQL